ncbi:hypothetical protein DFQ29_000969 [Apophysomyces sp. BC1021]|nr:hypothetical protein DFQ29_000969 [Apophysomyces sp. BC1021]
MEVPYTNYSRAFITELNKRQDILACPSLQPLLDQLSANVSYKVTLESLFNAPAEQLKQYRTLYNVSRGPLGIMVDQGADADLFLSFYEQQLIDGTDRSQTDHGLLLKASQKLDTIILMVQKHTMQSTSTSLSSFELDMDSLTLGGSQDLFTTKLDFSPKEEPFENQVDCSHVVDIVSGSPVRYQLESGPKLVIRDDFLMVPDEAKAVRVHLVLRSNTLLICKELQDGGNDKYSLLYPAIPVNNVTVNAAMLDRELIGEYLVELTVLNKKKLTMRAYSKETRNTWVGLEGTEPATTKSAPRSLSAIVQKYLPTALNSGEEVVSSVRKQDTFSFYTDDSGEISPMDSSSDEDECNQGHPSQPTTPITPPPKDATQGSKKALPQVPAITADKSLPPAPVRKDSMGFSQRSPLQDSFAPVPAGERPTLPPKSMSGDTMPRLVTRPAPPEHRSESVGNSPSGTSSPRHFQTTPDAATNNQRLHPNHASRPTTPRSSPTSPSFPGAIQKPLPRTSSMRNRDPSKPNQQRPAPPPHAVQMGMQPYPPSHQQPPMQNQNPPPRHPQASLPGRPPMMVQPQHPPSPNGQPQRHPSPQPGMPYANYRAPSPQPSTPGSWNAAQRPGPAPVVMRSSSTGGGAIHHSPTPSFDSSAVSLSSGSSFGSERAATPRPHPGFPLSPRLAPFAPEDIGSPPRSPNLYAVNGQANAIRQVLYGGQCEVFRWKDESWYAVEGNCRLEVRQTYTNRSCVSIRVENTNELYLNAWIMSNTEINRPSETDVGISVFMGTKKEEYLIHFQQAADAAALHNVLQQTYQAVVAMMSEESALDRSSSLQARPDNVPQTLKIAMQCKCKLFVQNEHSNWSSFGSVVMKISQQLPSRKMHIEIDNQKGKQTTKLVSAIVQSRNVERLSAKRITVLLVNEHENISIVYMIQIKEEQTGDKIYEYLKTKNAENEW